jgi:hypothetical protein
MAKESEPISRGGPVEIEEIEPMDGHRRFRNEIDKVDPLVEEPKTIRRERRR